MNKPFKLKLFFLLGALPLAMSSAAAAQDPAPESVQGPQKPVAESWSVLSQSLQEPLPNPLTLKYLLNDFPLKSGANLLAQAQSRVALAQAQTLNSTNGFKIDLEGRLTRREFTEEPQNHNLLALHFGKVLYDGDLNKIYQESLYALSDAAQIKQQAQLENHKLQVMSAFFDALLADFQYRIDNEAMAVEYIAFDKSKDQHSLSRLSDVQLLEAENTYQKALLKRSRSEQNLLKMRLYLANAIGYADARPDKLAFPNLSAFDQRDPKSLSLNELQKQVEQHPLLQALKTQWEGQLKQVQAAHQMNRPKLRADAWVGQLSSHPELREGRWRADLSLAMPLYDSGLQQARVEEEKAKLISYQAQYEELAQALRQEVTDLYFQIQMLAAEEKSNNLFADYADLYLDYSRALYENESATDLGDSMVRLSQANYNQVEWQFRKALLWAKLDYLLGKPLEPFGAEAAKGSDTLSQAMQK